MIKCRLNVIFAERGIKKTEFAKSLSINGGTLSSWCGDKAIPSLDMAYKVAQELNLNVMEIWVVEEE